MPEMVTRETFAIAGGRAETEENFQTIAGRHSNALRTHLSDTLATPLVILETSTQTGKVNQFRKNNARFRRTDL
jgi:hypothetical protein